MRDLREQIDRYGHISVDVVIGDTPGVTNKHHTGATAKPATVANFLRELADDIERLG